MRLHLLAGFICALVVACSETAPPGSPADEAGSEAAPPPVEEMAPPPPAPVEPEAPEPVAPEPAKDGPPAVSGEQPQEALPPAPAEPEAAEAPEPGVDLATLEQRLRNTKALGVFTKLALKNEIDDLVEAVDKLHSKGRGQLPELRERFDLLLMKLMSLLQDDDPELADEIASSREHLWKLLADPREFARLST